MSVTVFGPSNVFRHDGPPDHLDVVRRVVNRGVASLNALGAPATFWPYVKSRLTKLYPASPFINLLAQEPHVDVPGVVFWGQTVYRPDLHILLTPKLPIYWANAGQHKYVVSVVSHEWLGHGLDPLCLDEAERKTEMGWMPNPPPQAWAVTGPYGNHGNERWSQHITRAVIGFNDSGAHYDPLPPPSRDDDAVSLLFRMQVAVIPDLPDPGPTPGGDDDTCDDDLAACQESLVSVSADRDAQKARADAAEARIAEAVLALTGTP